MLQFTGVRVLIGLICFTWLLFPVSGMAEDPKYFIPAYNEEELAQVRDWEGSWVGKKISSANVDEVKEFVPEPLYGLMKDTERWGDSWFEILPYQEIPPTPGAMKLTKEYYGQTTVGSEGEILNYVSGVPFPDTKDPVELAHNFRMKSFGDCYESDQVGYVADGRLKYDLTVELHVIVPFFAGRTDTPPVPELENNPKQIWRALLMEQFAPPEVRDLKFLEIHYKDHTRPYDRWLWQPAIRRVRRSSTTERQDPKGPADNAAYDNQGFDGAVQENTYKYLGTKDLLLVRHQDMDNLEHTEGDCIFDGMQRERIKMHVIEAVHRDPNFFYSKMIWYVDPETWIMLYRPAYDRRGQLWKVLENTGCVAKGYGGVDVSYFNGNQMIDVQRIHSTVAKADTTYGISFDPRDITLGALSKGGR